MNKQQPISNFHIYFHICTIFHNPDLKWNIVQQCTTVRPSVRNKNSFLFSSISPPSPSHATSPTHGHGGLIQVVDLPSPIQSSFFVIVSNVSQVSKITSLRIFNLKKKSFYPVTHHENHHHVGISVRRGISVSVRLISCLQITDILLALFPTLPWFHNENYYGDESNALIIEICDFLNSISIKNREGVQQWVK